MECTLQVGDEVVLVEPINTAPGQFCGWETIPQLGEVYTIREVFAVYGHVLIRLVEIVNAPADYVIGVVECAFRHERFRKVEKPRTETSIEIFRRIDADVFSKPTVDA